MVDPCRRARCPLRVQGRCAGVAAGLAPRRLRAARSTSSARRSAMRVRVVATMTEALAAGQRGRDLPGGHDLDRPRPAALPRQPAAGGDRRAGAGAAAALRYLGCAATRSASRWSSSARRRWREPLALGLRRRRRSSGWRWLPPRPTAGLDRRALARCSCAPTSRRRSAFSSTRPDAPPPPPPSPPPRRRPGSSSDRLERGVELVDERDAVRDVEADDVVVGDVVEVLHQRADAVAVRGDQHALAGADRRRERAVPERQHARDRVLQAFGERHLRRRRARRSAGRRARCAGRRRSSAGGGVS